MEAAEVGDVGDAGSDGGSADADADATTDPRIGDVPLDSSVDDVADGSGTAEDTSTDASGSGDTPVAAPACAENSTGAWLITTFEFVAEAEDGTVEGYDLDDRISGGSDREGCRKQDGIAPDGTLGIDNQFAALLPALQATGVELDELIGARIREGTLLLLAELDGEFGGECEAIRFVRGDGNALLDADGTYSPYQTLDRYEGATQSESSSCEWTDPCAVSMAGESFVLEFLFITQEIRIELLSWRGDFQARDDGGLTGIIGGAVSLDSVMEIVTSLGGCGDEPIREAIEPLIPLAADIFPDEDGDCQGISVAVRIEAVPAFIYED